MATARGIGAPPGTCSSLNLLSKPENGRILCNNLIFQSIEYLAVIIVTDRKCNVTNNVFVATSSGPVYMIKKCFLWSTRMAITLRFS